MMHSCRRIVLVLLLPAMAACGKGESSGAAGRGAIDSNGGRYRVRYKTSPEPIPLNEPFSLTLEVSPLGPSGPAGERRVDVDARMPAHGHGMNRVARVTRLPEGSFRAEGLLFHMPGRWELYVDVSEGGRVDRAQVEIELK